jgi:hypothetical protein
MVAGLVAATAAMSASAGAGEWSHHSDADPVLEVTKTVVSDHEITGDFTVYVECSSHVGEVAEEGYYGSDPINAVIVFDGQGHVKQVPSGWNVEGGGTVASLKDSDLRYLHCVVTEDAHAGAAAETESIAYDCESYEESQSWSSEAMTAGHPSVEFGCTSDNSGQFTSRWSGCYKDHWTDGVTESGGDKYYSFGKCLQVISIEVINTFAPTPPPPPPPPPPLPPKVVVTPRFAG